MTAQHAKFYSVYQTACSAGVGCSIQCDPGYEDCDGLAEDGCECVVCPYGFSDCNHNPDDGCEHYGSCPEAGVKKDGASSDADADTTCAPAAAFADGGAPTWTPASSQNACTTQDVSDFDQACFSKSATTATCDSWTKAQPTCADCLLPPSGSPTLGPFIADGYFVFANVGGCIALVSGDESALGCGAKEAEADQCARSVCEHCQDDIDYSACLDAAPLQQPCSSYAFVLCDQPDAGAVYDTCFSEKTFGDYVTKLGALFCSNGSSDASTD
jgi:hypothetical protein